HIVQINKLTGSIESDSIVLFDVEGDFSGLSTTINGVFYITYKKNGVYKIASSSYPIISPPDALFAFEEVINDVGFGVFSLTKGEDGTIYTVAESQVLYRLIDDTLYPIGSISL